jgi:hypothetical protein
VEVEKYLNVHEASNEHENAANQYAQRGLRRMRVDQERMMSVCAEHDRDGYESRKC